MVDKTTEDLEVELAELRKKAKESQRRSEIVRDINKIKRGPTIKILWHLWNGLKIVLKWFIKFLNGTFKIMGKMGQNADLHNKKPAKKKTSKKTDKKTKSESYNEDISVSVIGSAVEMAGSIA